MNEKNKTKLVELTRKTISSTFFEGKEDLISRELSDVSLEDREAQKIVFEVIRNEAESRYKKDCEVPFDDLYVDVYHRQMEDMTEYCDELFGRLGERERKALENGYRRMIVKFYENEQSLEKKINKIQSELETVSFLCKNKDEIEKLFEYHETVNEYVKSLKGCIIDADNAAHREHDKEVSTSLALLNIYTDCAYHLDKDFDLEFSFPDEIPDMLEKKTIDAMMTEEFKEIEKYFSDIKEEIVKKKNEIKQQMDRNKKKLEAVKKEQSSLFGRLFSKKKLMEKEENYMESLREMEAEHRLLIHNGLFHNDAVDVYIDLKNALTIPRCPLYKTEGVAEAWNRFTSIVYSDRWDAGCHKMNFKDELENIDLTFTEKQEKLKELISRKQILLEMNNQEHIKNPEEKIKLKNEVEKSEKKDNCFLPHVYHSWELSGNVEEEIEDELEM
ncbi:hypothetical protein B7939_02095 [Eggerthia catenaformis]|nr:hypothetical protein B7939_02095 [Eggerthia catenaformis]